jgi:hypothetical protein
VSKEKKELLYEPLNITIQLVMDNLATSCSGYFPDKIYYLIECINVLMSDIVELQPIIKKKFGKRYSKMIRYQRISIAVKTYYDTLDGSAITKDDFMTIGFLLYQKAMSNLPLINPIVYEIFFDIIKQTKLKDYSIPSESLARAERKYKRFEPKEETYSKEISSDDDYDEEEY